MSLRRIIFVLIALIVSGGTVLVGRAWLAPRHEVAAAPIANPNGPSVLVAATALSEGQFVRPENLRWQTWPTKDVSAAYVVEGKGRVEDFIGAVARSAIAEGEPVTEARLVRPGDRGFMAAVLTPGYRAITVPVTVSSGIAGFVFPGDRVDLLLTMTVSDAQAHAQRHAAETLLTDLRVLAVDQRSDDQNKNVVVERTATLEVTPKQAETIAVGNELGTLSLSLRSLARGTDIAPAEQYSHTWDSDATHLIGAPDTDAKEPARPDAAPDFKVSVVRGVTVSQLDFTKGAK